MDNPGHVRPDVNTRIPHSTIDKSKLSEQHIGKTRFLGPMQECNYMFRVLTQLKSEAYCRALKFVLSSLAMVQIMKEKNIF